MPRKPDLGGAGHTVRGLQAKLQKKCIRLVLACGLLGKFRARKAGHYHKAKPRPFRDGAGARRA